MKRNTTADRFKTLCKTCKHFHCVTERSGVRWCTYKGRPVGFGTKCSKFRDRQLTIYEIIKQ